MYSIYHTKCNFSVYWLKKYIHMEENVYIHIHICSFFHIYILFKELNINLSLHYITDNRHQKERVKESKSCSVQSSFIRSSALPKSFFQRGHVLDVDIFYINRNKDVRSISELQNPRSSEELETFCGGVHDKREWKPEREEHCLASRGLLL